MVATALSVMGGNTTFIKTMAPMHEFLSRISQSGASAMATTEQDFSFAKPLNPRVERKLHELQLLDAANDVLDKDAWDVMEVKTHRVSTMERNLPCKGSTRSKHIRFLCRYQNGKENWSQADAV
jgi:hypothetical protein